MFKNALLVGLAAAGGFLLFKNRFTIQRRLESWGIKTPLLKGSVEEAAKSIASQVGGKMEHGATIAEMKIRKAS